MQRIGSQSYDMGLSLFGNMKTIKIVNKKHVYSIGDVIHKLINAHSFVKTLMDQMTTPTGKTKWKKEKTNFLEYLKALLGGCTMTLNMSVYLYPNLKLFSKEP